MPFPRLLLDVITPSMGQSRIFEHTFAAFLDGEPFGATTDLAVKDMRMGVELAEELGVPVDVGALVRDIFIRFRDEGGRGQGDYTELIQDHLNRSLDRDLHAGRVYAPLEPVARVRRHVQRPARCTHIVYNPRSAC